MNVIKLFAFLVLITSTMSSVLAQTQGYQTPSAELAKLVDAPLIPASRLSANGKWLALLERKRVVSLAELDQPEQALAGIKFNPNTFMRSNGQQYSGIEFKHVDTGALIKVSGLPREKSAPHIGALTVATWRLF